MNDIKQSGFKQPYCGARLVGTGTSGEEWKPANNRSGKVGSDFPSVAELQGDCSIGRELK